MEILDSIGTLPVIVSKDTVALGLDLSLLSSSVSLDLTSLPTLFFSHALPQCNPSVGWSSTMMGLQWGFMDSTNMYQKSCHRLGTWQQRSICKISHSSFVVEVASCNSSWAGRMSNVPVSSWRGQTRTWQAGFGPEHQFPNFAIHPINHSLEGPPTSPSVLQVPGDVTF